MSLPGRKKSTFLSNYMRREQKIFTAVKLISCAMIWVNIEEHKSSHPILSAAAAALLSFSLSHISPLFSPKALLVESFEEGSFTTTIVVCVDFLFLVHERGRKMSFSGVNVLVWASLRGRSCHRVFSKSTPLQLPLMLAPPLVNHFR
jgi:hypothetical protein